VEKLCHRFHAAAVPRHWRDLSYCLSLFTFSDKAVKKLQDNLNCFSDKLHDEAVFSAFTGESWSEGLCKKCFALSTPWDHSHLLGLAVYQSLVKAESEINSEGSFAGILVQARKTVKADTKPMVDELEDALNKARDKCAEDHGAKVRAERAKGGGRVASANKKSATGMKKRREEELYEDEDEESEGDSS